MLQTPLLEGQSWTRGGGQRWLTPPLTYNQKAATVIFGGGASWARTTLIPAAAVERVGKIRDPRLRRTDVNRETAESPQRTRRESHSRTPAGLSIGVSFPSCSPFLGLSRGVGPPSSPCKPPALGGPPLGCRDQTPWPFRRLQFPGKTGDAGAASQPDSLPTPPTLGCNFLGAADGNQARLPSPPPGQIRLRPPFPNVLRSVLPLADRNKMIIAGRGQKGGSL